MKLSTERRPRRVSSCFAGGAGQVGPLQCTLGGSCGVVGSIRAPLRVLQRIHKEHRFRVLGIRVSGFGFKV